MAVGNGNSQNKAKPNTGRRITNAHNVLAPSIMSFRNDAEGFKSLRQCALLTLSLNKDNKHGIIFLTSEDLYKERFLFFALLPPNPQPQRRFRQDFTKQALGSQR